MARKTALETVERTSWDTYSYYDSATHASMFRKMKPHNFGVKEAQLFSAKTGSHLVNKKFTYMTAAKGNFFVLPGGTDDYEWYLVPEADVEFRATELLVSTDSQPGKGNMPFEIGLDRPFLHEPAIIKTESRNLPMLKIIGHGIPLGENTTKYTVELQTGDPNAWIPVEYLMPQRRFIDASTSVSDELNTKYAGDQYGDMFKLQSWVGNYARKAEFTDKFIRMEIACRKKGNALPKNQGYKIGGTTYNEGAISSGFVYQQKFAPSGSGASVNNDQKKISAGVFVSNVEARLSERVMRDREMNCEFGQLQKTEDHDSGRTIKVSPGYRQLVKDKILNYCPYKIL